MKTDLENIKETIQKNKGHISSTYGVKSVGVFGSVARGENKETSDIDILVEFEKPVGFFKFLELEEYLSEILGKKVDMVTKNALKPSLKQDILQEVSYV